MCAGVFGKTHSYLRVRWCMFLDVRWHVEYKKPGVKITYSCMCVNVSIVCVEMYSDMHRSKMHMYVIENLLTCLNDVCGYPQ